MTTLSRYTSLHFFQASYDILWDRKLVRKSRLDLENRPRHPGRPRGDVMCYYLERWMQLVAVGPCQTVVLIKSNGHDPGLVQLLKVDVTDILGE